MKSEVIIAIVIGFAIGLAITFGIYQAQKLYVSKTVSAPEIAPSPTPTPEPIVEHTLEISSPSNFELSDQDTITISGSTTANAYITLVSETLETTGQADSSGAFAIPIELAEGANLITITAINENGDTASQDITVSYIQEQTLQTEETEDEQ